MIVDNTHKITSRFLSVEKDASIIASKILENDKVKKLLYYTTKDALRQPKLTEEQSLSLMNRNIKFVPKIYVDKDVLNYIIISFDDFFESENPEFRYNVIMIDIICHFDQWNLGDFKLRPYKIAAEIDASLDEQKLTGIGRLEFQGAKKLVLTDELGGICLMYKAYHGEEDKKPLPKGIENETFRTQFLEEMGVTPKDEKE